MSATMSARPATKRAMDALRRAGNPFRNSFARNPDDESCARYHVPELFATERGQLLGVVDLYRYDATTHSEVVPVLGNKGAGKTHLLHTIKHSSEGAWQLLVTPGVYQKDTDFLEYLLYQIVDTLLGGGRQKGVRPLDFVSNELCRRLLSRVLTDLSPSERAELIPTSGLSKWARKFGLGAAAANERASWLLDSLSARPGASRMPMSVRRTIQEAGLTADVACEQIDAYLNRTESHDTSSLMRRAIYLGFCRAALAGDESTLANFLTNGFAELNLQVRTARGDLVLSLFKALMGVFRTLKVPVVVAFDQLEDLLLARRSDDAHRIAEAFFAGIVQAMHQLDGLCFVVFAERGLWNRFVPSLDGYIQDRLNNPVHVPQYGTLQALKLEAPPAELVRQVVEARLRPTLDELPDAADLSPIFPFTDDQVIRIARTEPTLRDMLQQFRHLFDHLVFGVDPVQGNEPAPPPVVGYSAPEVVVSEPIAIEVAEPIVRDEIELPAPTRSPLSAESITELWEQEQRMARRRLEPEGSLTGATRELQAGLGAFLQVCHEHGVKVGPWRLQHVVGEWTFGDHPTYGALTIAHWACKDGQPWKVGIGLFLARGAGKPKDLEIKLRAFDTEPSMLDHLILLRPEEDLALTGKSKTLWQECEGRGRHARIEAMTLDSFAQLSCFPRWLAAMTESMPDGQPMPNLADLIQDKCERLLEQVCMPVQG